MSATLTIPEKLTKVEHTLNGLLLERQKQVSIAVTALVSKSHFLQVGSPGVAKTFLFDLLMRLIGDVKTFRWLMTRFTTPEELFGPFSLKGLENDEFRRHLSGKMIGTDVSFLDEGFKANSAILNSLLTIMEEGLFFNGADIIETRPIIFMGSNELPKEAELAALYDRVHFRIETQPLRENASMLRVLQGRVAREGAKVALEPIITWAEITEAQEAAARVKVPDLVLETMITLKNNLKKESIEPTDRRWANCIPIIQACAYRDGRDEADIDDMGLLRYALWNFPSDIPTVDKLVLELANPYDKRALDLIAQVDELSAEVDRIVADTDNETARRRRGVEVNGKLTRVDQDLTTLMEEVKKSPRRAEMVDEARTRLAGVVNRLLKELFGYENK